MSSQPTATGADLAAEIEAVASQLPTLEPPGYCADCEAEWDAAVLAEQDAERIVEQEAARAEAEGPEAEM